MKSKKSGFTLVEIMIVVMIIALLALITIPNLARARKHAQRSTCIENLRQINGAMQQYMIEKNVDTLPTFNDVLDYFQTKQMPECPAEGSYVAPVDVESFPTCTREIDLAHSLDPAIKPTF